MATYNAITDLGCNRDGVTDDTAIIQDWIDNTAVAGDLLYFPAGANPYLIGTYVNVTTPVELYSDGWSGSNTALSVGDVPDPLGSFLGADFLYAGPGGCFRLLTDDVTVRGVHVYRAVYGGGGPLIGINLEGSTGRTHRYTTEVTNVSVLDCVLRHGWWNVGMSVARNVVVANTWMTQPRSDAVFIGSSDNVQVRDNTIIEVAPQLVSDAAVTISHAVVATAIWPNDPAGQTDLLKIADNSHHVYVTNNLVKGNSEHWGIRNYGCDDFLSWNNEIHECNMAIGMSTLENGHRDTSDRVRFVGDYVNQTFTSRLVGGLDQLGFQRPRAVGWWDGSGSAAAGTFSTDVQVVGCVLHDAAEVTQAHWVDEGIFTRNQWTGVPHFATTDVGFILDQADGAAGTKVTDLWFGENYHNAGATAVITGGVGTKTDKAAPSAPSAPTNVIAARDADGEYVITWDYTQGTTHDAFEIEYKELPSGSFTPLRFVPPYDGAVPRTDTGENPVTNTDWVNYDFRSYSVKSGILSADPTQYQFQVRAVYGTAVSTWAQSSSASDQDSIVMGVLDSNRAMYAFDGVQGGADVTLDMLDAKPKLFALAVNPSDISLALLDSGRAIYGVTITEEGQTVSNEIIGPLWFDVVDVGDASTTPSSASTSRTSLFRIGENDTKPDLTGYLRNGRNEILSLETAANAGIDPLAIVFSMRKVADGLVVIDKAACTWDTGTNLITYAWAAADTDDTGEFVGEIQVTLVGGAIFTAPHAGSKVRILIGGEIA